MSGEARCDACNRRFDPAEVEDAYAICPAVNWGDGDPPSEWLCSAGCLLVYATQEHVGSLRSGGVSR